MIWNDLEWFEVMWSDLDIVYDLWSWCGLEWFEVIKKDLDIVHVLCKVLIVKKKLIELKVFNILRYVLNLAKSQLFKKKDVQVFGVKASNTLGIFF